MFVSHRASLLIASLLPISWAAADAATLAGHWEGAIHAPAEDVAVAVDVTADTAGTLAGTFSNPAQRLNGYPLVGVATDGAVVKLELKTAGPGVQTFDGRFSADGNTIAGEFLIDVHAVPFTLKRAGAARVVEIPKSAAVDAKLAGSWRGSLDVGGRSLPLHLTLTNHADRSATGVWSAGDAPAIPVAISYESGTLTLSSPITPASFSGTVNAAGTEITGTLLEGSTPRAVVFTRLAGGG